MCSISGQPASVPGIESFLGREEQSLRVFPAGAIVLDKDQLLLMESGAH